MLKSHCSLCYYGTLASRTRHSIILFARLTNSLSLSEYTSVSAGARVVLYSAPTCVNIFNATRDAMSSFRSDGGASDFLRWLPIAWWLIRTTLSLHTRECGDGVPCLRSAVGWPGLVRIYYSMHPSHAAFVHPLGLYSSIHPFISILTSMPAPLRPFSFLPSFQLSSLNYSSLCLFLILFLLFVRPAIPPSVGHVH